MVKLKLHNMD